MNSIVITGASGSMGAEAVKAMCRQGYPVIMACRNLAKGGSVRESILREVPDAQIELRQVDMASLASVRAFAEGLQGITLAGLFNNAGVISRSYALSPDGIEGTLAVNYAAPYLLTRMLLPQMEQGAHIVNMVSLTSKLSSIDKDILHMPEQSFSQLGTYGKTKLALLLFTAELDRRIADGRLGDELCDRQLHINMADPGIVNSNMISMGRWFDPIADILFRPLCKTPAQGAAPAIRAMLTDRTHRYFVGRRDSAVPSRLDAHPLREWLWNETADLVGLPR